MSNVGIIKSALETSAEYMREALKNERATFAGHEGVSVIADIEVDLGNNASALTALAELESTWADAVHFARHFIRDDPEIAPREAIIRLGDKCTELFCRMQAAERERDQLRARLAEIDAAPTVAYVDGDNLHLDCQLQFPAFNCRQQWTDAELIARPEAK